MAKKEHDPRPPRNAFEAWLQLWGMDIRDAWRGLATRSPKDAPAPKLPVDPHAHEIAPETGIPTATLAKLYAAKDAAEAHPAPQQAFAQSADAPAAPHPAVKMVKGALNKGLESFFKHL